MTTSVYNTYRPPGFHTMTPYLMAKDPNALVEFLKAAFYAVELDRTIDAEGVIRNILLQIGDTCFMMGTAAAAAADEGNVPAAAQFVLYVNDPDALHARALQHGAIELMKVEDREYNDRQVGVEDIAGNKWWISKRLEEKPY